MKYYFIGFFTSTCIFMSLFFYYNSKNKLNIISPNNSIVIDGELGKTIIEGGQIKFYNNDNEQVALIGNSKNLSGEIILFNKSGHKIVNIGAHFGDGMSGNGILSINNQNGEYGWSVIGKVSSEHYN